MAARQQTCNCGKIAIASFRTLEFAKFKAELRIRLVAKRCGCSEGVLILVLIFDWEVRHHGHLKMLTESLLERERFDKRPVEAIIVAQKNA